MTRRALHFGTIVLLAHGAFGCGGSDKKDSRTEDASARDSGNGEVTCPVGAPEPDEMMGPCCFRASNAENPAMPTLRLAAIKLTAPASLASPILVEPLSSAIDEERFRWLMQVDVGEAGAATVRTGYAQRLADGRYTFCKAGVPAPCKPDEWGPQEAPARLEGETLRSTEPMATFSVPIYDEDGVSIPLTLPLRDLLFVNATFSEERSCVGELKPRGRTFSWDTTAGALSAFVTVEDARKGDVIIEGTLDTSLCAFMAGLPGNNVDCASKPRSEWSNLPDALCDENGCEKNDASDICNPETTCNAWQLTAEFAAQGVPFGG